MKQITFIAIAFLFSVTMFAQTTIKGNVTDAKSGDPLPGVNIKVVGKSLGTTTNFDGEYTLKVKQTPPFDVEVSLLGYTSKIVSVAKSSENINVSLIENASTLDEVVVSASRTPESVRESPVTVERMDIRDIKKSTSPSFYNSIGDLKGVDINTSSLTFNSVNTRGFATYSNTRFVQLVDGMDNASPALNFVMGNFVGLNELDVESIELLPGASSALYGANAFNGILFMTSKSPFDHTGISFYAKRGITSAEVAGDNPYTDFGVRAAYAFSEKFAAKASFSYLEGTDWQANDTNEYTSTSAGNPDAITEAGSPGHNAINLYGDEVATTLDWDAIASLPAGTLGKSKVARTPYKESDLTDYKAKNLKFDTSLHYRPFANDLELIYNMKVGAGNTIYQGASRYQMKNFMMMQNRLELKNKDFFLRAYRTTEDAGDSYNLNFTGINLAKIDMVPWFNKYAQMYLGAMGGLIPGVPAGDPTAAHAAARSIADAAYRIEPGTARFEAEKARIMNVPIAEGSKSTDETSMNVAEGNYNFSSLLDGVIDLQVGGSYRNYELNSGGTIFTDNEETIKYNEVGAYVQAVKKLVDDRLKLSLSARYDKNVNFDANISPRLSVNYAAGEKKQHNFRASYQTGFRNPTTQDLYIGLDVGTAILIGSAEDNLDKSLAHMGTNLTARDGYENAYTVASAKEFSTQVEAKIAELMAGGMGQAQATGTALFLKQGVLESVKTDLVKPEEVVAIDFGYRGKLGKVSIDFNAYFNTYANFISNTAVITPLNGTAGETSATGVPDAVISVATSNYQAFQLYTNSDVDVSSYGAVIGLSTRLMDDFRIGANYTYAKLDFDQDANPDFSTNFNTPEHKVKFSLSNPKLYKGLGFNVNVTWNDEYLWEATAGNGMLESKTLFGAMLSYDVPKWKSSIKIGGANLGATEYVNSIGGGTIGAQYFASWTINN